MKDYKKILEGVVNIINTTEKSDIGFANICTYIGENCPELRENEDERIKKVLIDYFNRYKEQEECGIKTFYGIPTDDILAWLEKQGEQKPIIEMKSAEESLGIDSETYNKIVDECIYGDDKSTWGKQGEQKPADKVEPKFKVGDEIKTANEAPLTITEITDSGYWSEDLFICGFDDAAKWELVEQKPTWSEEDEQISNAIVKYLGGSDALGVDLQSARCWVEKVKDRIQPKQEWSEEDENMRYKATAVINRLCAEGKDYVWSIKTLKKLFYWLKSLRPQPKQEVDEQIETIAMHLDNCGNTAMAEILRSCNLRPQNTWKPSDEQIKVLDEVLTFAANHESPHWNNYIFDTLNNLIRQLQKLKE